MVATFSIFLRIYECRIYDRGSIKEFTRGAVLFKKKKQSSILSLNIGTFSYSLLLICIYEILSLRKSGDHIVTESTAR